MKYYPPKYQFSEFSCPHCGIYTDQVWRILHSDSHTPYGIKDKFTAIINYEFTVCKKCNDITIWDHKKMIYPLTGGAPLPHDDMPKKVTKDYNEARSLVSISPKASCALLRLCVEKLCEHLGEKNGKLNTKISNLTKSGKITPDTQKALDSIRVIGAEAIHPLTMNIDDDQEIALKLFLLVNLIVQSAISDKNTIENIYKKLPKEKKQGIINRDNNNSKSV